MAPHAWGGQFRSDADHRDFAAIGTAAGVATAFNAPIGGLLFTVEEGCSFYSTSVFWRGFLATCTGVMTLHCLVRRSRARRRPICSPIRVTPGPCALGASPWRPAPVPAFPQPPPLRPRRLHTCSAPRTPACSRACWHKCLRARDRLPVRHSLHVNAHHGLAPKCIAHATSASSQPCAPCASPWRAAPGGLRLAGRQVLPHLPSPRSGWRERAAQPSRRATQVEWRDNPGGLAAARFGLHRDFGLYDDKVAAYGQVFYFHVWELPLFAAMGALGGLAGAAFIRMNVELTLWRHRCGRPPRAPGSEKGGAGSSGEGPAASQCLWCPTAVHVRMHLDQRVRQRGDRAKRRPSSS